MKVLVLGHRGMLGRSVYSYLKTLPGFEVLTLDSRWGDNEFKKDICSCNPDYIINAIGKIPQKQPATADQYSSINIELPRFLETLGIKTILPSTDCEFSGQLIPGQAYTKEDKRDATDPYGKSKADISSEIQQSSINTKIIRTSIVGHEENTALSLVDWFLSQTDSVRGYTNHYWNGITTLEWAKQCQLIIEDWDSHPILNQLGTEIHYSKFEIISLVKKIYNKDIEIIPFETELSVNKCLVSDKHLPELSSQIIELKTFFQK